MRFHRSEQRAWLYAGDWEMALEAGRVPGSRWLSLKGRNILD